MSYMICVESDPVLQVRDHDEICLQLPLGQIKPELREWLGQLLDKQIESLAAKMRERLLEEVRGY